MIKFPCKCGHQFNVVEDLAGGLTQCPRCGLLADIPQLSDLPHLHEDGTFHLDEEVHLTEKDERRTLAELQHVFSTKSVDPAGRVRDLRNTADQVAAAGDAAIDAIPLRVAPKYDPFTGELIRPLEVQSQDIPEVGPAAGVAQPVLPLEGEPVKSPAKAPSLSYALGETRVRTTNGSLPLELLMPANSAVMFFMLFFYFAALFAWRFLSVAELFVNIRLQVLNIPILLILAHYGCVIEETGPEGCNELPRPLRNLGLVDDMWNPMIRVAMALAICFLPVVVVQMPAFSLGSLRPMAMVVAQLAGAFLFPAVVLTMITGTTILNLRPDRLLGVIRRCGGDYLLAVVVFMIGTAGPALFLMSPDLFENQPRVAQLMSVTLRYIFWPLLLVHIYLMHLFCWYVGRMYRSHSESFPWILQRHMSTRVKH